jgi:hypothetical protein
MQCCNLFLLTYCNVYTRCYAMIARSNMSCLVTAGKHVNNIVTVAKQRPITTIEKLLKEVFSVGTTPHGYITRTPGHHHIIRGWYNRPVVAAVPKVPPH